MHLQTDFDDFEHKCRRKAHQYECSIYALRGRYPHQKCAEFITSTNVDPSIILQLHTSRFLPQQKLREVSY